MSFLKGGLLMLIPAVGILGPLFWSMHKARIDILPTNEGWLETRRSLFDHVIGFSSLIFGTTFTLLGIASVFARVPGTPVAGQLLIFSMLPMGLLFLHGFLFSYLAFIRFNSEKIEYRAFHVKICESWENVREIKLGNNGPTIYTISGKFSISNTRRGFYQLLATARMQGVQMQENLNGC